MTINPQKVLKLLVSLMLLLVAINAARVAWGHYHPSPEFFNGPWARFDLDKEGTVPAWFSSMVLMTASVALWLIAIEKRRENGPFKPHWFGLAIIFLLLSLDEASSFHELLGEPMSALNLPGPFHFAWVIAGGTFVIGFAVLYLPFVHRLPPPFRLMFIASGAVYVFGAVFMEMVGGEVYARWGIQRYYHLCVTIEETCEMLGASFFVYTLLTYLQAMGRPVTLYFGPPSHASRMARPVAATAEHV